MAMFKDKSRLVIETTDRFLKVAEISLASGYGIVSSVSEEIPPEAAASIPERLRRILKANSIGDKMPILVIPRQSVTVKSITLPSLDKKEIGKMAAFQAIKQIPYPKEEIVYGFDIIDTTPEGFSKVLLIICHRDAVERPISILKDCGLNPSSVMLSTYGLVNWLGLGPSLKDSYSAPILLIDCDISGAEIAVIYKGKPIYSRGVAFGVSADAGISGRLTDEVKKTLAVFERENAGLRPLTAVLTGDLGPYEGIREDIERSIGVKVNIDETAKPGKAAGSFSALVGAACGQNQVNLLPKTMRDSYSGKARRKKMFIALLLAAAVVASSSLVVRNKIQQRKWTLMAIERRLADIAPAAEEAGRKKLLSDVVESQRKYRRMPATVLAELQKITPQSIDLTNYRYEEGKVEIKGMATALSEILGYAKILENSPLFENVTVRSATPRRSGNGEVSEFDIFFLIRTKKDNNR